MGIFGRYTLREVFRAFLPAFIGLTLLVVIAFSVQMLHKGVDVVRLRSIIPHLFTYAASMVISAAFLTALIMTFGRMSDDNELLAVQCAGVHLRRVVTPVLALAVFMSLVTALLLVVVVPWSRRQINLKRFEALKEILVNNIAITSTRELRVPGYVVTYEKFEDGAIKNVQVIESKGGVVQTVISAREGKVEMGARGDQLPLLRLSSCVITNYGEHQAEGRSEEIFCQDIVFQLPMPGEGSGSFDKLAFLSLPGLLQRRNRYIAETMEAAKLDDPRKRAKTLRKQRIALILEVRRLGRQVHPMGESLRERERDYDGLARELDAVQINIHNVREERDALRRELRRRIDELRKLRAAPRDSTPFEEIERIEKRIAQLRGEIESKEGLLKELTGEQAALQSKLESQLREIHHLKRQIAQIRERRDKASDELEQITEVYLRANHQYELRKIDILISKRLALAFACIPFALIGVPFGIFTRRGNVVVALGLSFAVVLLVFYPFVIAGEFLAESGHSPWLLWGGNLAVSLIGLVSLKRALRR